MNSSPVGKTVLLITVLLLTTAGCLQSPSSQSPAAPGTVTLGPSQTIISNETLVAFVDSAVAYVHEQGKEKALREFSDPHGRFVRGELYIFAYDFNGTTLAHPVNPEKISVNRLNETEGNVGVFLSNMSAVARNGSGFYRFSYINPVRNRTMESKLGYGVKVDDTWWLGSGVYAGPVEQTPASPDR
jgi:signal transduction histidine kinase